MRVPLGIDAALQAAEDIVGRAAAGEAAPAQVRARVHLDAGAAAAAGIGRRAGADLPAAQQHKALAALAHVRRRQVAAPLLRAAEGGRLRVQRAQLIARRHGGALTQPPHIRRGLAEGPARERPPLRAQRSPERVLRHDDLRACGAQQLLRRLPGEKGKVAELRRRGAPSARRQHPAHAPFQAGDGHHAAERAEERAHVTCQRSTSRISGPPRPRARCGP